VEGPNGESIVTDMPAAVGGGGAAPSPGWFFRAGLAACVGSLVAIEAARDGIRLETLRVEVDSESDDRGILGMDESTPAGPLSVRVAVHLTAPASKGDGLRSVAERAATRCPVFDTLGRAIPVALDVHTA
jgi:uncharacterized OsmC-like protein